MTTYKTTYKTTPSNRMFSALAYRCVAVGAFAFFAISPRAVAAGEETFKTKCAACHGADGSGSTVMGKKFKLRDLRSADVQKQTDEELQSIIVKGKPPMPAFGKTLDTAKVQELVAYIRSSATK